MQVQAGPGSSMELLRALKGIHHQTEALLQRIDASDLSLEPVKQSLASINQEMAARIHELATRIPKIKNVPTLTKELGKLDYKQINGRLARIQDELKAETKSSSEALTRRLKNLSQSVTEMKEQWQTLTREAETKAEALNNKISLAKKHRIPNEAVLKSITFNLNALILPESIQLEIERRQKSNPERADRCTFLKKTWHLAHQSFEHMYALYQRTSIAVSILPKIAELTNTLQISQNSIQRLQEMTQKMSLSNLAAESKKAPAAHGKSYIYHSDRLAEEKDSAQKILVELNQRLEALDNAVETMHTAVLESLTSTQEEISRLQQLSVVNPALELEDFKEPLKAQSQQAIQELLTQQEKIETEWNEFCFLLHDMHQAVVLLEKAHQWNYTLGTFYLKMDDIHQTCFSKINQKDTEENHQHALTDMKTQLKSTWKETWDLINPDQKEAPSFPPTTADLKLLYAKALIPATILSVSPAEKAETLHLIVNKENQHGIFKRLSAQHAHYSDEVNGCNQIIKEAFENTLPHVCMLTFGKLHLYEITQQTAPALAKTANLTQQMLSCSRDITTFAEVSQKASLKTLTTDFKQRFEKPRNLSVHHEALDAYRASTLAYPITNEALQKLASYEEHRTYVKSTLHTIQAEIERLEGILKNSPKPYSENIQELTAQHYTKIIQELTEHRNELENNWNAFCFFLHNARHQFLLLEKMRTFTPLAGGLFLEADSIRQICRDTRINVQLRESSLLDPNEEEPNHLSVFKTQKALYATLKQKILEAEASTPIEEKEGGQASQPITQLRRECLNALIPASEIEALEAVTTKEEAERAGLIWGCEARQEKVLEELMRHKIRYINEQKNHNDAIKIAFEETLPHIFKLTAFELERMRIALNSDSRANDNQFHLEYVPENAWGKVAIATSRTVIALITGKGDGEPVEKDHASIESPFNSINKL